MKEADELEYWLYICNAVDSYPMVDEFQNKLIEIKKILNKIISSSKNIKKIG